MSRNHAVLAALLAVLLVFGGTATTLGTSGSTSLASDASDAAVGASGVADVRDAQNVTNTTVTFENQTSNGTTVTVAEANLTDGGFVVIHTAELLNGTVLESVVGVSEYLEPGVNENVTVDLDRPVNESQTLLAVAYQDTNDNQEYDFVESRGEEDGAYTEESQVVVEDAFVTVESEPTTTPEETTTTPETTTETPTTTPVETTPVETTPETTPPETTTETPTPTTTEKPTPTPTTQTPTTVETTTPETTPETTTPETTTIETTTIETTPETTTPETTPTPEPAEREFVFRVDSATVENVSFLVGDAAEPDRTVFVEDTAVRDETVELDLTEILREDELAESADQTVLFVLRDVEVENVTLVVTAPEGVTPRLVRGPPAEETTTPVETTPEETTTPVETTTTPAEPTTTPIETTTQETTPVETTTPETTPTPETTTEEPTEERASLRVSNLTAPKTLVLNEGQLVVNARVTNPGEQAVTETVELRLGGTVIETQQVELGPGESERVQFRVDRQTLDVEPGETFVGVLTRDFGQVQQITVRETGQPDDEATKTTTEVADGAEGDDTDAETDATDEEAAASLRVSELDAPSSLVLDEGTLVVTAQLANPTEQTVTDAAELRVDGTVVETQQVEVGPGETAAVRFEVSKQDLGLAPGETFLEVLTRDFGESISVTVESGSSEEETTAEA
jgi:outer membrane biosynthesis protein TonB